MAQRMAMIESGAATVERLKARAAARGVTVPELLADLVSEEGPASEARNGTGRDCQESCVQGHSEAAGGGLWRSRRAHWTSCFRDVTPSRFSPRTVCSMS